MKFSIFRNNSDLKAVGILEVPDGVSIGDVQKFIYDFEEKYLYEENGFVKEKNMYWYDYMAMELKERYGVVIHEHTHDIYF